MSRTDTYAQTQPASRAEWRQWLTEHHASLPGVWLVYCKKVSGQPSVTYAEAVEEALCFGWIDSHPRKLDADRTQLLFTPRKPKSGWSRVNKERLERLEATGQLMPAGLAAIARAKQNGAWESLDAAEAGLIPADLAAALAANAPAAQHFAAFSASVRKMILTWVLGAKQPETRARRIMETVRLAALNKRATLDRE
ncbi:YdeI/OmpD-associated family protein [Hymenobacter sp. BT186]|uniref:YdeI/OmpD-associated family protein n=1 Tax=Hymenobacter telluris TaxID=2816474 RepID=A0A939EXE0_9BACT|nr:YdeI/OmpD-associated family protein [Hymenobacter telluris]MBO0358357.1 YdeI/OmpD-associated family protein [Hymenobacter telluris]MBW3374383.1 YdeI/OmpD-associated family protein [Hymenobacter norwichensis]